jgi:hypothetical protein
VLLNKQFGGAVVGLTLFTLLLTLSFTLSMHLLPQVRGEFDDEPKVALEGMTMERFILWGEELYHGRGSCPLCHNTLGRAPDIMVMDMVTTSQQRLDAENYRGEATTVEGYLRESMVAPNAYVVPGYGKKGSHDTISQMPIIGQEPIVLNAIEMDAIIAFMQDKDGAEVTVSLPRQQQSSEPTSVTAMAPEPAAEPAAASLSSGAEVARHYGCNACHSMLGSQSPVGPQLEIIDSHQSREQLRSSIIEPNQIIAEGFSGGIMPADYAQRMRITELELLLDWLEGHRGGQHE